MMGLRIILLYLAWIGVCLLLGFALAQYGSAGLLTAFLHKSPGCF
jgi:hypothetical protein